MRKKQKEHAESGSIGAKIFRYAIMAIVLFISLYPILWVLISSFKEKPGGLGLPEKWVFDGYITIFTKLDIQTYFLNSIIITCVSTLLSVTIVAMAAYVVARMNFKGKGLITLMFSTTLFIPAISISFPIYRLLGELGLRDTRIGVIFISCPYQKKWKKQPGWMDVDILGLFSESFSLLQNRDLQQRQSWPF